MAKIYYGIVRDAWPCLLIASRCVGHVPGIWRALVQLRKPHHPKLQLVSAQSSRTHVRLFQMCTLRHFLIVPYPGHDRDINCVERCQTLRLQVGHSGNRRHLGQGWYGVDPDSIQTRHCSALRLMSDHAVPTILSQYEYCLEDYARPIHRVRIVWQVRSTLRCCATRRCSTPMPTRTRALRQLPFGVRNACDHRL